MDMLLNWWNFVVEVAKPKVSADLPLPENCMTGFVGLTGNDFLDFVEIQKPELQSEDHSA